MSAQIAPPNLPNRQRRIIRTIELQQLVGLSKSTIYRLIRAGRFPSPFRLAVHAVGFDLLEVQDWMDSRKATREEASV